MTFLTVLDVVLLSVILLCAGDALRQLHAFSQPFRCTAFGLVAVGAFGWITHDLQGAPIRWWGLALHAGFAIYAVLLFIGRNPLGVRRAQPGSTARMAP